MDYGVSKNFLATSMQWQIPDGFQLVPGGLLGLGMLLTKESARWLAKRGRREEAMTSLVWLRKLIILRFKKSRLHAPYPG
jgi:hypothetical protein